MVITSPNTLCVIVAGLPKTEAAVVVAGLPKTEAAVVVAGLPKTEATVVVEVLSNTEAAVVAAGLPNTEVGVVGGLLPPNIEPDLKVEDGVVVANNDPDDDPKPGVAGVVDAATAPNIEDGDAGLGVLKIVGFVSVVLNAD